MSNWLTHDLQSTAAWRDRCSEKYPSDTRNYQAAKNCRELADMTCDDTALEGQLQEMSEDDAIGAEKFNEAKSDVLGSIGFYFTPKKPEEIISRFIELLS